MSAGHSRVILNAFPALADAEAAAAQIRAARVEIVAVQLVKATRPVAYIVIVEGHGCPACNRLVDGWTLTSEGV